MKTIIKIKTALWALFISQGFYAQSPGGVSGTQLWYKGNAGITQAGTVTQWNNSASASYNLVQQGAATTLPTYNAGAINFNPTVRFDGVDDRLYTPSVPQTVTTTASAPYATSQYIVFRKLGSVNNTFYSHSDGAGGTWNVGSAATGMIVTNRVISTTLPVANEIRLMNMDGNSGSAGLYVNGSSASTTLANTTIPIGTQNFWVGAQGTTIFSNADIAEIVIYNSAQPSGRQQIESYLALKYGITKAGNYTSSGTTYTFWNATTNTGYNNNIAGIGRDDNSALYQRQSMSINSGQQVLIGLNNMNDTNDTNTGTLANQQFMTWGDNGLTKAPLISISGISDANARFASVWKVQNTNTVGTVRVMWPQGLTNLKLVQNTSDPTFTTGNIVTNMTGTQIINGITYNYADVTLSDGQYFTFAALIQAPGGVVTNLQVWNRADFGTNTTTNAANVTTWNNSGFTGGQLQALSGFSLHTASPTFLTASTSSNFNPSVRMIQGAGLGMLNAFSTNATTSGTGGTFYNVSKAGAGTSPTLAYNVQMNVSAATLSAAGSSTGE
ncbi:hypothetical protein, partial [Chryseobacterium ginsengisoli]|uniref:hypothetical protein n=1 Tax=Chryseobacterium ginsengisoli TaxID=363853 RepID=UPI003CD08099